MYSGGNFSCSIKKILRLKENFVLRYICLIDSQGGFHFLLSSTQASSTLTKLGFLGLKMRASSEPKSQASVMSLVIVIDDYILNKN